MIKKQLFPSLSWHIVNMFCIGSSQLFPVMILGLIY